MCWRSLDRWLRPVEFGIEKLGDLIEFQIMTATVETVAEQLDLAAIMPAEKVVTAVARSVTLSDTDVGM